MAPHSGPGRPVEQDTENFPSQKLAATKNALRFSEAAIDDAELQHDKDCPEEDESSFSSQDPPARTFAISTIALCMCMFTHSYLLISVFPYRQVTLFPTRFDIGEGVHV